MPLQRRGRFENPNEAIAKMVSPAAIVTLGGLPGKYVEWAEGCPAPMRDRRPDGDLSRVERPRCLKKILARRRRATH